MDKRILIIDDDVDFTDLLKGKLEKTGKYNVQVENHGLRGSHAAKAFRPDLILLDVMMPDMDGSDVAEQIRADEHMKNIPIVFLTSIVREDEVKSHGGTIGGQNFISKTLAMQKLIDSIEQVFGK